MAKYVGASSGGGVVASYDDMADLVRALCCVPYVPAGNYAWDAARGVGIICGCCVGQSGRHETMSAMVREALTLAPDFDTGRGRAPRKNPGAAGVRCPDGEGVTALMRRDGLTSG